MGTRHFKVRIEESKPDKNQGWIKVVLALPYKRMSKERRKGNPPTPNNLSLYTLHLPSLNHPSCSEVPSEYPTMILHIANATHISTTVPHHLTSQHRNPLPYRNKLCRHHLPTSSRHSRVPPRLHLAVTLILSVRLILIISILKSITLNPNHGSIPLLGSRSSENIFQRSWLPRVSFMKLPHCLKTIHQLRRFPCQRIVPSPIY